MQNWAVLLQAADRSHFDKLRGVMEMWTHKFLKCRQQREAENIFFLAFSLLLVVIVEFV
jgi:hypothetical protein